MTANLVDKRGGSKKRKKRITDPERLQLSARTFFYRFYAATLRESNPKQNIDDRL